MLSDVFASDHIDQLFRLQAQSIEALAQSVDKNSLVKAAQVIAACTGRVVLSGLGKSGLVAQKIAATWSSTGTPSLFLHASEALHGDAGVLRRGDVWVSLSNSGETDELLRMIPLVRRLQLPHITLVGNLGSTLARNADIALFAGAQTELLQPDGLAAVPLASSLAAMALGDVLAVLLVRARGFVSDDFRALHPAGHIGQKMLLQVRERMRTNLLPTAHASTPLRQAVAAMSAAGLGAIVVVDDNQRVEGIFTDGDLRRWLQRCSTEQHPLDIRIGEVATPQPQTLAPDASLLAAEELMAKYKINVLPIVDSRHQLVGILSKWETN